MVTQVIVIRNGQDLVRHCGINFPAIHGQMIDCDRCGGSYKLVDPLKAVMSPDLVFARSRGATPTVPTPKVSPVQNGRQLKAL